MMMDNLDEKLDNLIKKRNALQGELNEQKNHPDYSSDATKSQVNLQASIVKRIGKNPELGAVLFSRLMETNVISSNASGSTIGAKALVSSDSNVLQLFAQLPKPSQKAVIAHMDNSSIQVMVTNTSSQEVGASLSNDALVLLDTISKTKAELMGEILGQSTTILIH